MWHATTFEQECVLGPNDQRPILAKLKYVGWVEEILELKYGVLNVVVLLCDRVKTNYIGSSATMKRDEYGFTFINFASLIPISDQSFAFPLHVNQVFFSNDPKERGWKVVLKKKPHKKRVTKQVQSNRTKFDMFRLEKNDAYVGLQTPISIDEANQRAVIVGGSIVIVAPHGGEDDGANSDEEYAGDCSSDG